MRRISLNGIFVSHVTPFTREGELDEEALRTCVRFRLRAGFPDLCLVGAMVKPLIFLGRRGERLLKPSWTRLTERFRGRWDRQREHQRNDMLSLRNRFPPKSKNTRRLNFRGRT